MKFGTDKLLQLRVRCHNFMKAWVQIIGCNLGQDLRKFIQHSAFTILPNTPLHHIASTLKVGGKQIVDIITSKIWQDQNIDESCNDKSNGNCGDSNHG